MQTLTRLELKLEEARRACERMRRKLHGRLLANWLMPEYYVYFEKKLEELLGLVDEILGSIATSRIFSRRTEMLSRALMEGELPSPAISLIQTGSNQGAVARELSNLWQNDEERMAAIEELLREFNQSLRELQGVRDRSETKLLLDMSGFPVSDNLPEVLSLELLQEIFEPDRRFSASRALTETPPKRSDGLEPLKGSRRNLSGR